MSAVSSLSMSEHAGTPPPHRRRPRYSGKYPRHFAEKYKEHNPGRHAETVAKVLASGKTPAGTHRPIMVREVLEMLVPQPGQTIVDCTLGFGGHAAEILPLVQPGGLLIGLDADPIELPKTEARLRSLGFSEKTFLAVRSNFAGLPKVLGSLNIHGVDAIIADLGVSSMQLDDPSRGFSLKFEGPLDMRMNPQRGQPASALLEKTSTPALATFLQQNADEPHATELALALAGKSFASTSSLAAKIRDALSHLRKDDQDASIRRVFQTLRIAVNEEFSALESLLRALPSALKPGGRAAILTFHSGEDRRVKKSFQAGLAAGAYSDIAPEVVRPSAEERRVNPRSAPAKLRWAIRSAKGQSMQLSAS
jgi:16S rRNA (cytosine1402-N4)-methyltransferase